MECPHCSHDNREGARSCDACGTSLDGGRAYTPRHLAETVLTTRAALEGERKQVTVLFADVVDSMKLAEGIDPEEWHRVLDRVFDILARSVHRFEGTINQFTGDGVMALFGAPVAHEDHAHRACHAALAAMAELERYAETLRARGIDLSMRMGLNSGEVVVGKIGDDLRMDYTAQGHCVGLAARVEHLAAPGTVLLTEHTARLVEGFFELSDRGIRAMKGVSAPVRVLELRGIGPLRTRLDASGLRGFSRLIGREAELVWLERILARAIEGNGQVVGIVGDAGVGKSRLCREFVQHSRARGIAAHEVRCPSHGAAVPWLAIRDLLRSYLSLSGADGTEAIRRGVAERLHALDTSFGDAVPLVLRLLGVGDEVAPNPPRPEDLASFMRRLIRLESAREPIAVVILLDDAHWIDPASDALMREVAAAARDTRTLLVLNFRPEYQPAWIGGAHYHQIALPPLDGPASRALLQDLLGPDGSLGDLVERIRDHTAGNPLFAEEVVQALAGSGSLAGERGAYRLAAPVESLALPATVQSLLAGRIDRLGDGAKHVLQVAAVIGQELDEALLAEVCGLRAEDLAAALEQLQQEDFLRVLASAPRPQHAFRHPLMRDAAYGSQLRDQRARRHAAVAAAVEKLWADRLGEHASLIAHHLEASGMRFEAARWKRRAALNVANIQLSGRRPRPQR